MSGPSVLHEFIWNESKYRIRDRQNYPGEGDVEPVLEIAKFDGGWGWRISSYTSSRNPVPLIAELLRLRGQLRSARSAALRGGLTRLVTHAKRLRIEGIGKDVARGFAMAELDIHDLIREADEVLRKAGGDEDG